MFRLLSIITAFVVCVIISLHLLFPLPDRLEFSTVITGKKGEVLHAFLTKDEKWRIKAELHEVSPLLRSTIIHKEDRYFYLHRGVNPFAIIRAGFKNILRFRRTSGASTITMQVARALDPGKRTYMRKLAEVFRAFQLEWKYNKDEILQMYCNLLPYGGNVEGIKSASLIYLNKAPDHLSLAEIVALSVIPNRPSSLVPGRNNEKIMTERNRWLKVFQEENLFTGREIEDALQEPFTAERSALPRYIPHLANKLKKQGKGYISTPINMQMQFNTEKIVGDYTRSMRLKNIRNAAVVIIDNRTHEVVTYLGSAGFNDTIDGGQVDGADAVRQPGSTLKPFLYGLCIDEGLITPKSVITDVNISYDGYSPENYNKQFNGYVTMEDALGQSLNIPAVKMLRQLGTEKFISSMAACRMQQIKKDRRKLGLSMVLGGCGATLTELTGVYAALACDGNYYEPSFTTDRKYNKRYQLLSEASTFMINETLSRTGRPDFPLNWQSTARMPKIAWKTGTSYGRRDAWSIGYNKKYTVGVWVGNFSGQGIPELSGAETATPLLFRIFNTIDYDSDQDWFSQPVSCDIRMVCAETGMLPGDHCSDIVTDYFIPLKSSTVTCNNRQEFMVSADEKISYCLTCAPSAGYKKKVYPIIPPEMQTYLDERHMVYEKLPFHNPACEKVFRDNGPQIISPLNGMEYLISRSEPEPLQLRSRTSGDVSRVFWYINNRFYKSADAGSPVYFMPEEGPVRLSCTDDKGRNTDIRITVKRVDL